jgi:hypothetical protein
MTNVDTLANAGLISDPTQLSQAMKDKINGLSDDEVTHLLAVRAKLGDADIQAHNNVMCI